LSIETKVGIPALEDLPTQLLGGESRLSWIARYLSATVADTANDAHKLGMSVA